MKKLRKMLEKAGLEAADQTYDNIAREEVNKMREALQKIAVKEEPNKKKVK